MSEDKTKLLGQVFTPSWVVGLMLDSIGYNGGSILGRSILEPSFGKGVFLLEIVRRYIKGACEKGWGRDAIRRGLESHVHGIEIDEVLYHHTLRELDSLASSFGIRDVCWSLRHGDSLLLINEQNHDYVVGNPPYIKVHNLAEDTRNNLKRNFFFCKQGMMDIYLSFFELGLRALGDKGRLIYITPNSYMRNTSNSGFRYYITEHNLLSSIMDFESERVFKEVVTYNCITLLEKGRAETEFSYYKMRGRIPEKINTFQTSEYVDKKFVFTDNKTLSILSKIKERPPINNYADVQYGICTQRDSLYVGEEIEDIDDDHVLFNGNRIERGLLKPIVKGSRMNDKKERKIIFPYVKRLDKWIPIDEDDFNSKYPFTYQYLSSHKEDLLRRDMDAGVIWYAYGRSQSIQSLHQEKLILDMIVNRKVNISIVDKDTLMYSGIAILPKHNSSLYLNRLMEHLQSDEFLLYLNALGKNKQGGYKMITTDMVRSYGVDLPCDILF